METGFFNLSSSFYVASMNDKLVKTFLRQSAIECDILIGHELKVQFYVMMVHIPNNKGGWNRKAKWKIRLCF